MNFNRARPIYWILFAAWCVGLTLLVYGGALRLPFFFDDFVHYPFVQANNIAEIWLTTDELAYYRPLNFTLWRITYDLFNGHNPLVDHALNLVLHALNGVLVGWLAIRLWSARVSQFPVVNRDTTGIDWLRGYVSATLFLLYPLSYQAVPWVGSMSHLLVTALVLLSLTAYVQMRRTRQRLWGAASLFFALLAPFAHENGVLVMPLIVLIELTTPGARRRVRSAIQAGLIWTVPLAVYVPIWFTLPRVGGGGLFPNNLEGILQNTAYFLQGIFYPFTWVGGWLHTTYGLNDMVVVGVLSGIGLAVALFVQVTQRATLRSWLPWLWVALASLPAILFLVFEYVINGPRLLMLASVGAAWLWADVFVLVVNRGRVGSVQRWVRTAVAGFVLAVVLWQSYGFIRERMDMHAILGEGFQQVLAAAERANAAGEEAVVVNFPSWLATKQPFFALGHEGVLFWPDYVPPEIFMAVHTGEFGALNFVRVDAIRPDLEQFYYGLTGPVPEWDSLAAVPSQVFMTVYGARDVGLLPVGELGTAADTPQTVATFGADAPVVLQAAQAQASPEGVRVDLWWETAVSLADVTVFVHLLDAGGQLVAQADGEPLGGSFPFELWSSGEPVHDTRWVAVPDSANLRVQVGLYNRLTGGRLMAIAPDGERWPDDAVPVEIVNSGE